MKLSNKKTAVILVFQTAGSCVLQLYLKHSSGNFVLMVYHIVVLTGNTS